MFKIIITFLLFFSQIHGLSVYNDFEKNPHFSKSEKEKVKPYLMPVNHPIKPALDRIFSNQRPTLNAETFAAAGFVSKFIQPRSFIHVASHPDLPGYLVKAYLDSELRLKNNTPSWKWLVNRAKNARKIEFIIKRKNSKYFTVAQKWIYPLPSEPSPPSDPGYSRKNEILVVEDMNLVSDKENEIAWKTLITKKHLDEFYAIITFAGGSSYRIDNVAYTTSGKFAFIDTEYTTKYAHYRDIVRYLSPEMAAYWKVKTGVR